jgi:tetratricopeptide (TPR) repeat protein
MYSLSGQPENALEDYNKAIALNQNFATTYVNCGNLYQKSGRKDLTFLDFQRVCFLGDAVGAKSCIDEPEVGSIADVRGSTSARAMKTCVVARG